MREIKFRAWDIVFDRMVYGNPVDIFKGYTPDYIMQYTGVKDCNNVEIYEGDLIELFNAFKLGIHEVIYDTACFGIYERGFFHDFSDEEMRSSNIRVVGNIYQNK